MSDHKSIIENCECEGCEDNRDLIHDLRARVAEVGRERDARWKERDAEMIRAIAAEANVASLEAALRDCIEGYEGAVPDFWRSPLGKRLSPLVPTLWPGLDAPPAAPKEEPCAKCHGARRLPSGIDGGSWVPCPECASPKAGYSREMSEALWGPYPAAPKAPEPPPHDGEGV